MAFSFSFSRLPLACAALVLASLSAVMPTRSASAEALLLIEADTGKVLQAENATFPWYPASITKVMTAYVTLHAVKEKRLSLDTLLTVSPNAAAQQPSKMGFAAGTRVTVDNALKMLMVRSANDMAVVLAEGVAGSIDAFSDEMNRTAKRLGMTQSSFVNPNGLPAEGQITSARDIAILARAVIRDLPEYEYFMHIPAIRFGRRVTQNYNKLIGRYPGADGMKTGFICASGFNLVATATRGDRRLIAVVLGAPSSHLRAVKAAQLLDNGFSGSNLTWLKPALGTVDTLAPVAAAPPNLRDEMCGPKRKRPAAENEDEIAGATAQDAALNIFTAGFQPSAAMKPAELLALPAAATEPVIVYTGPARTGAAVIAAAEEEAQRQAEQAAQARAKRTRTAKGKTKQADKKTAADGKSATTDTKTDAAKTTAPKATAPKTTAAKSADPATAKKPAASHAPAAKPPVKPAPKPAPTATPAAKPAAPKAIAPKTAAAKPAPAQTTAAKPAAAKPKAESK